MNKPSRKPTNLSLSNRLLAETKALNINLSRAAENGVESAVLEAMANPLELSCVPPRNVSLYGKGGQIDWLNTSRPSLLRRKQNDQ